MFSNRLAFALLGAASITAAAAGGYLASRQDSNTSPAVAPSTVVAAGADAAPALKPVEETEAVVGDGKAASRVEARPTLPARRADAGSRVSKPPRAESERRPNVAPPAAQSTRATTPTPAPPAMPLPAPAPPEPQAAPLPERVDERVEAARLPEPPVHVVHEIVVAADSVIGLQTETAVSSERARVEDRVEARVVRDVRVGGDVAIPAGTRAIGSVMVVDRGGKFKERARLGVRFHTLVLADGTRLPLTTETIFRYGDAPGNRSTAKIGGGAVAGAILGAILGGAKGAAIGATTGAGAGTAAVVAGGRDAAEFPAGTEVTARILSPVTVTVEK
jgi:hypothetical protein